MRRLIAVPATLLACLWVVGARAAAPLGNQFCVGVKSPVELARIVVESLAKDPQGLTMLDPVKCNRPKPARPIDYLEMFKIDDPTARLMTVTELPAYLDSLVIEDAPQGKFWMACLKQTRTSTSGWHAEHNCIAREFNAGEKAWVNPVTHRPVLAEDCTNPVALPERVDACVYIYFTTVRETGVRLKEYGPRSIADDGCTGLKRAGETDFESPWEEECPEIACDFSAIDPYIPEPGWRKGSFKTESGVHVLRLPRIEAEKDSPYRIVFCVERWVGPSPISPEYPSASATADAISEYAIEKNEYIAKYKEWNQSHSCGLGVRWDDYQGENPKVATIYYTEAEAVAAKAQTTSGRDFVLWWHWQDADGKCIITK